MLKVADIRIANCSNDESRLQLEIMAGPRDVFITGAVTVFMSVFVWILFIRAPLVGLIFQMLALVYGYNLLENTTKLTLDMGTDSMILETSKFDRIMRVSRKPLRELVGTEMVEKDLKMGGSKAFRLELNFSDGSSCPLTNCFIIDLALIDQLHKVAGMIDTFIETFQSEKAE